MEVNIQNYLNSLCCINSNCTSSFATKEIISLANSVFIKVFESLGTCVEASKKIETIGSSTIGYAYPTSINGATIELLSLGNVSLGFGF
jgi:hypothetical protein